MSEKALQSLELFEEKCKKWSTDVKLKKLKEEMILYASRNAVGDDPRIIYNQLVYLWLAKNGWLEIYGGFEKDYQELPCALLTINRYTSRKMAVALLLPENEMITSVSIDYKLPSDKQYYSRILEIVKRNTADRIIHSNMDVMAYSMFRVCTILLSIEVKILENEFDNLFWAVLSSYENKSIWSLKGHAELCKFLKQYWGIDKGRVFNPNAGAVSPVFFAKDTDCDYEGNTSNLNNYIVSSLYLDDKVQFSYTQNPVSKTDGLYDYVNGYFDYIVWDGLADYLEKDDFLSGGDSMCTCLLEHLAPTGKAAFVVYDDFFVCRREFSSIPSLETVVFFDNHICLLLFDNTKKNQGDIRLVDALNMKEIKSNRILYHIQNIPSVSQERETFDLMEGYLDFEFSKREFIIEDIEAPMGYKAIPLGDFMKVSMPSVSLDDSDINTDGWPCILDYNKSGYDPLTAILTRKDAVMRDLADPWSNVNKRMLLINQVTDASSFHPMLFSPVEGTVNLSYFGGYVFDVDESQVYIDYLICEMNKPYFSKQLYPCGRTLLEQHSFGYYCRVLLSLYILIPDVATSVERQKQIIAEARQGLVAQYAARLGFDFGRFVEFSDSNLPEGRKLLGGKYTIIENISHGGFGKVYKAMMKNEDGTESLVAIKEFFYHKEQGRDPKTQAVTTNLGKEDDVERVKNKFRIEANKIKEFSDNEHIIDVYEVFDENNTCYYSMEYIDGESLGEHCKEQGTIKERDALDIIRQVALALKSMHELQYNHHDVKPGNILIDKNGRVVLVDFGTVHKYFNEYGIQNGNSLDGESTLLKVRTEGYLPEYAYEIKKFHAGIDIYSLGATLYKIVTDKTPRNVCRMSEKPSRKLSDKAWSVIKTAMQNDPDKALKSVDEFLALLEGI